MKYLYANKVTTREEHNPRSSVILLYLTRPQNKMKQQTHDKLNVWRTRKKSEPQMGFAPTILRQQSDQAYLGFVGRKLCSRPTK